MPDTTVNTDFDLQKYALSLYPFKTIPFKHQLDCWNYSKDKEFYGLFLDMGTGKTKISIDTAGWLHLNRGITGLVVLAPKGVYRNWVRKEIPEHMSEAFETTIGTWSSAKYKADVESVEALFKPQKGLKILAMNIESLSMDIEKVKAGKCAAATALLRFLKENKCLVVVDESTTIKNPKSNRTKVVTGICRKYGAYRRVLTGNPIPNGPLDLYTQADFLKKDVLGFSNFYAFRNRFAVMKASYGPGGTKFDAIVGYRDHDKIQELMSKFAFIIKKEDCLDLPEKLYQVVDVEMSPKQKVAYNKMWDESYVELSNGERLTAVLVMTKLMRLTQIACGFMPREDGSYEEFESNPRLDQLLEDLEQIPGKAIIWCGFVPAIEQILKGIRKKFGEQSVVHFYGATTEKERERAKDAFQDPSSPVKFIVANPASGKFGNTWTMGTTVFYYSNDYDLEKRQQSEDRSHRIGQRFNVLYTDYRVPDTVEDRALKALKAKREISDSIVVSNWKWLIGEKVS